MNGVYFKKYLTFTEASLHGKARNQATVSEEKVNSRLHLGVGFFILILCFFLLYKWTHPVYLTSWINLPQLSFKSSKSAPLKTIEEESMIQPNLPSHIPTLDAKARIEFLQPIELKRAELLFKENSMDRPPITMIVMDKVIVMPKEFITDVKLLA